MLGDFSVTIGGTPVQRWRAGKARSLFQYLVVHRDRVVLRATLHEVLWPHSERAPSSSSLKVAMHALRQILQIRPDGGDDRGVRIVHHAFGYALYADRLYVDVDDFEAKMEAGRAADKVGDVEAARKLYSEAMKLYTGDFLAGDTTDWIIEYREWCRTIALRALDRLCTEALRRDEIGEFLHWCRRVIDIDPYREETYRLMIALHGSLGELGAARRWYEMCLRRLRNDLDIEPTVETEHAYLQALYRGNREVPGGSR
jgi:DNA-binding SARP family transcriptional activator